MDNIEKMRGEIDHAEVERLREIDRTLLAALKDAREHIRHEKVKNATVHILIVCMTILLMTAIICGSILCFQGMQEQQYALNMQYASLMEYVAGAEISETETTEAHADGNGTAVAGSNNTIVGGDMNGGDR